MPLYAAWYWASTVPPSPSTPARTGSCWLRSCALALRFSESLNLRPASPCCSATEAPVSCNTTVTGWLETPSGVHAGLMVASSPAGPGRTAPALVLPKMLNAAARTAATRLVVNRIYSSKTNLSRETAAGSSCPQSPTAAPLLLESLMAQDMYLAGSFVLLICALTLVGSLVSDILLALVDPRIRLE